MMGVKGQTNHKIIIDEKEIVARSNGSHFVTESNNGYSSYNRLYYSTLQQLIENDRGVDHGECKNGKCY